jgi:hypothetical protein
MSSAISKGEIDRAFPATKSGPDSGQGRSRLLLRDGISFTECVFVAIPQLLAGKSNHPHDYCLVAPCAFDPSFRSSDLDICEMDVSDQTKCVCTY